MRLESAPRLSRQALHFCITNKESAILAAHNSGRRRRADYGLVKYGSYFFVLATTDVYWTAAAVLSSLIEAAFLVSEVSRLLN